MASLYIWGYMAINTLILLYRCGAARIESQYASHALYLRLLLPDPLPWRAYPYRYVASDLRGGAGLGL